MEVKKNLRNELFKRNELILEFEDESNPGFEKSKKMISDELSKPEENIDVYSIKNRFGSKVFIIEAYVYDSKEDLENLVELRKTKKQKKKEAEEKKKQEEEKAEEKPSEEVSEESKTEAEEKPREEVEEESKTETEEKPSEDKKK